MGKVRIISGIWRGRKIEFPDQLSLRPTHDRIRETLFNWLAPYILDANCLDLFAGSGALGFEAASRGAKSVVMYDQDSKTVAALTQNSQLLKANNISIQKARFPEKIAGFSEKFDIVFLDPPYESDLIVHAMAWLEENNYLQNKALIYLETRKQASPLSCPENWRILKTGATATINYYLCERQNSMA